MSLMFVVARDAVDLWDQLSREFAGRDVRIVVDRRRNGHGPDAHDGGGDRRHRPDLDEELRRRGFAAIPVDTDPSAPSSPSLATAAQIGE